MAEDHQELYIEGVGTLIFRRSRKAKRISIRIRKGHPAEVVIPIWSSLKRGKQFALQKKDWIRKHAAARPGRNAFIITEHTVIRTVVSTIRFRFQKNGTATTKITYNNDTINVEFRQDSILADKAVQSSVHHVLYEILKKQARSYLSERLAYLSEVFGFQYNQVRIKRQKTLWGSCSARNNINLNLYLILLPPHLIDYVLVHELVHTRHKNHGPEFWKSVDHCLGNGKKFARELRHYSIGLQISHESEALQLFRYQ